MPSANLYPDDINSSDARKLEEDQRSESNLRLEVINQNWDYYQGKMRQPLKKDGTGVDDNVTFPLVQNIVDKSVAGMLGNDDVGIIEGIVFLVLSNDMPRWSRRTNAEFQETVHAVMSESNPYAAQQRYIDDTWRMNRKGELLHNIFLLLSLTGHVFIKVLPNWYEDRFARLMPLDSRAVTVFWREDDPETPLWYRYEFGVEGRRTRQDFVRDDMGGFTLYEYEEQKNRAGWQPTIEGETWDWPIPPIVEWQNLPMPMSSGMYYGRDDVGVLIDLNDSVNFIASTMQRIQKHHAHPKTIVTGAEVKDINNDISLIYAIPNDQAKVYNLEMMSEMTSSLSFLQAVERAIYAYGREVDPVALVQKFGDRLTNFAVRVIHGDTLAKRQAKWMTTEVALSRLHSGLLALGNFDSASTRVDTIPPDPLPTDQFQQAETLTMDVANLGLSQITALERRGYDPATELARGGLMTNQQGNDPDGSGNDNRDDNRGSDGPAGSGNDSGDG